MLRQYLRRFNRIIPYSGNYLERGDIISNKSVIPWGFVPQDDIKAYVLPVRDVVLGKHIENTTAVFNTNNRRDNDNINSSDDDNDNSKKVLNYNNKELNQVEKVSLDKSRNANVKESTSSTSTEYGVAHVFDGGSFKAIGNAVQSYVMTEQWEAVDKRRNIIYGNHLTNPVIKEMFETEKEEIERGAIMAYTCVADLFSRKCDFIQEDICSPSLSLFLNDVIESYQNRNLEIEITIEDISSELHSLRMREGSTTKNRYLFGLMGLEECSYHLMSGMRGPEGHLQAEFDGNGLRKIIAEVAFEVKERIVIRTGSRKNESNKSLTINSDKDVFAEYTERMNHEKEEKENTDNEVLVVHETRSHVWTFESDFFNKYRPLEWSVVNINDAIKPALSQGTKTHNTSGP